MIFGKGIFLLG